MFCGAVLAEPILGWTQNFMLDDEIINSIINQFFKNSVNVREERNRSLVSRVKFITIFLRPGTILACFNFNG